MPNSVLRLAELDLGNISGLLARFGIALQPCADEEPIPASFWGEAEAGLRGNTLFARGDTPLHSILHEAGHYICLDPERRACLDTHAGSDDVEESAVCYLQILLADEVAGCDRARMFRDMDAWGYSFRLGCSRVWFETDAVDAAAWLQAYDLIDAGKCLQFRLRQWI